MRSKQPIRLYLILSILFLGMIGMMLRLLILGRSDRAVTAGLRQGQYHLHVPLANGVIYDRYGLPLTQSEDTLIAAVNPTPETTAEILPMLADKSAFRAAGISRGPVLCSLTAFAWFPAGAVFPCPGFNRLPRCRGPASLARWMES